MMLAGGWGGWLALNASYFSPFTTTSATTAAFHGGQAGGLVGMWVLVAGASGAADAVRMRLAINLCMRRYKEKAKKCDFRRKESPIPRVNSYLDLFVRERANLVPFLAQ